MFFNLLSNAFKFTPDNGAIKIKVSTVLKNQNQFVKIEIKDNGKGIPEKNIKYVFDRFYQIERDHNSRTGTGIGLALAKSVIKLHKGSISLKSKQKKGTKFVILLPFGKDHLNMDQIIQESNEIDELNIYEDASKYFLKETTKIDEGYKKK